MEKDRHRFFKVALGGLVLSCALASAADVLPRLILDSQKLGCWGMTRSNKRTLNSGWKKEGTMFVRPFNRVPAGIVRYGVGILIPSNVTATVNFVDAKGVVLFADKVSGGALNLLRGAFDQPGTLAAVRIEPTKAISPQGVIVKPFRMTVGWAVDEDFSYVACVKGVHKLPDGWRGKGAKVVPLPHLVCTYKKGKAGYDKPDADEILEIEPGGFADPQAEKRWLTDDFVFEFDALVDAKTDLVAAGVRLRDCYAFTPGVWYHFRFEVQGGKIRFKVNGRQVAERSNSPDCVIKNVSGTSKLLIDDVRAYAMENPSDYPSAPVRPKGEEKWDVLMNVCPLWHNGYHVGWECVEKDGGPKLVLGYYDEGLPETADWEIKYMVEHGVDVQLFCWYAESHDGPIRHPRNDFHLRDGFKNARYSNAMKYALIWEIKNAGRPHSLAAWKKNYVPYLIEHHFKDPRYYTVDGKPYLEIFGSWELKSETCFGSAAVTKEAFAYLDGELKKLGFKGLYVVWCHRVQNTPEIAAHGFDAVAPYGYGIDGWKIETQKRRNREQAKCPGVFSMPAVSLGYNSEPWHGKRYPMLSVADFETSLKWLRDEFIPSQKHKTDWEKRVIILSNWNEYGEGTYMMPTDDERGFGYLDVVRKLFTDERHDPSVNVRPTRSQRERICNLYPQRF